MGASAIRIAQVGKESTFKTSVAATAKLMGITDLSVTPLVTNTQRRYLQGDYAPAHASIQTDKRGKAMLKGDFLFEDLPIFLLSAVKGGVTPTTGTTDETWTFPFPLTASPAIEPRTWEFYDGQQEYELAGGLVESFELSGEASDDGIVQFTANLISADCVKSTLTSSLSNRSVEGLPASKCSLYIDALGGTIGSTVKADTLISWKYGYKTGLHLKKFSSGGISPTAFGYGIPEVQLDVTAEFNAIAVAELDAYLANTGRLYRIEGLGSLITGAIYKTLRCDIGADIVEVGDLWGDRDGNTTVDLTLKSRLDTGSFANYGKITVINALATMPG